MIQSLEAASGGGLFICAKAKPNWYKGYATEGSRSLLLKCFCELDTQRIVATALATNAASLRVMEKVGLKFEKTFVYQETNQEGVKYALNKDEFESEKYIAIT